MSRLCITASMKNRRTCTLVGEHRDTCEHESCRGCLPAPAVRGLLCAFHAQQLDEALGTADHALTMIAALAEHAWEANSSGISDGNDRVSTAFASRVPIPESRIMANQLVEALVVANRAIATELGEALAPDPALRRGRLPVSASTRDVRRVATNESLHLQASLAKGLHRAAIAEAVVKLLSQTTATARRFPLVEEAHRVQHVRCPNCAHLAMVWHPPLYQPQQVAVVCEDCGEVADQEWLEAYIQNIRNDPRRNRT